MNADEFMKWFGSELQNLISDTTVTERFERARDLVNNAIHILEALPPVERARVQALLNASASHKTGMIGDFRIPYDIRDDYDLIEGITATIEGYLEG